MEPAQREERVGPRAGAVLVSRTCEVPDVSYRAFLASHPAPRLHWAAPDGLEVVGSGAAVTLTAAGEDRFATLREGAATVFRDVDRTGPTETRPRFLGGLAFNENHDPAPPWTGFPAAAFFLPEVQLTRADGTTWLTVREYGQNVSPEDVSARLDRTREDLETLPSMCPSGGPPGVEGTEVTPTQAEWTAQVERAIERIRDGDLRKVVLATALSVDLAEAIDVPDVLERLRRTYPNCYRFLVQPTDEAAFFGPPPERLVKLTDGRVRTEALAGSVPRGETPEEDADHAQSLLSSEKLQHEQGLVVDAITGQLEPLGDVSRGQQGVRKLTNIQHLQTPIEATLADDDHVLTIVEALHPTPAVGGLPPGKAWEVIRDTETFDRGWYAAPVGWFDSDGDGEFAVGIRSGVVGGREATLFAGNGIVADSVPDEEWAEVKHKYRPILDELER
ncbi:isochorismate synthase [Halorientalis sp. IM1011]|uniref:isochorismate synthase n=1 Tax=Halorientalis sp. IM1011 TaxID=1932360 RepID=UPI00097CCEEA|nr:isochorismate synthase [Halorientalis sp. IM1011]AQL41557.1 isochorismate synthase [Halorientalis sp. IM1011]